MNLTKNIVILLWIWTFLLFCCNADSRWSVTEANKWYSNFKWGAGANYIPSYAANEIEFWEKLDFDLIY